MAGFPATRPQWVKITIADRERDKALLIIGQKLRV